MSSATATLRELLRQVLVDHRPPLDKRWEDAFLAVDALNDEFGDSEMPLKLLAQLRGVIDIVHDGADTREMLQCVACV